MNRILKQTLVFIIALFSICMAKAYDFEVDGIYYNIISTANLTCGVTYGDEKYSGDITIPNKVVYKSKTLDVTVIGSSAFDQCRSLKSIEIPNSVTSIGQYAFFSCTSLQSIKIPNSVTTLDYGAFWHCCSLQTINIPNSITKIGSHAFWHCCSLQTINIPNSVTMIGSYTFADCTSLKEIKLSNNLETLSFGILENCSSLNYLTIPGNIIYIDQFYRDHNNQDKMYTFGGCNNIKDIRFEYNAKPLTSRYEHYKGYSVTEFVESEWTNHTLQFEKIFIDRNFKYKMPVRDLKELTIGEHIERVDLYGLYNCENLETIICYSTNPPSIGGFATKQYTDAVVRVPAEALEAYQSADIWKNFWNIEAFDPSGIDNVIVDTTEKVELGRYDINGRTVGDNYRGLVIIRYSDGSTRKTVL